MRHILVPALLALAASASALDVGLRASYDIPPKDATGTWDISGGGFPASSSEWATTGTASRKALAINVILAWTDMGIAGDGFLSHSTGLVSSLGIEQVARHADEGDMTSASDTKLRGLYWEPGVIVAAGPHLAVEVCARLAMGRGSYAEDGLGEADTDYRTYGAVIRPIVLAYGVELFAEVAWCNSSIKADGMTPTYGAGESIAVTQEIKGLSYGAGVGLRF